MENSAFLALCVCVCVPGSSKMFGGAIKSLSYKIKIPP